MIVLTNVLHDKIRVNMSLRLFCDSVAYATESQESFKDMFFLSDSTYLHKPDVCLSPKNNEALFTNIDLRIRGSKLNHSIYREKYTLKMCLKFSNIRFRIKVS